VSLHDCAKSLCHSESLSCSGAQPKALHILVGVLGILADQPFGLLVGNFTTPPPPIGLGQARIPGSP
jgi:hypothetical protein